MPSVREGRKAVFLRRVRHGPPPEPANGDFQRDVMERDAAFFREFRLFRRLTARRKRAYT